MIMQVLFSYCCDCPFSGSMILGAQIVHITEGEGKLAHILRRETWVKQHLTERLTQVAVKAIG